MLNPFERTALVLEQAPLFSYRDALLFIGSCFSEEIGTRIRKAGFRATVNPTGTLFNPSSIANALTRFLSNTPYREDELFFHDEAYRHFDLHGKFARPDTRAAITTMNDALRLGANAVRNANVIFITFGTAWIFRHSASNAVVANCHKRPASDFLRERLSVDAITNEYLPLIETVRRENPNVTIVFTVSPVRHLKDGLCENQKSKATLLLAIEELIRRVTNARYFPAYEIMTDELRDYRFYANDLVHPSEKAADYIYRALVASYCSDETRRTVDEVERVLRAAAHRPQFPESAAHKAFIRATSARLAELRAREPFLQICETDFE